MYKILGAVVLLLGIALLGRSLMSADTPTSPAIHNNLVTTTVATPSATTASSVAAASPIRPAAINEREVSAPVQAQVVPANVSAVAYQSPLSGQIADMQWRCEQTVCNLRLTLLDSATMSMAAKTLQSLQQAVKDGHVPGQASVGLAAMNMGAHPKEVTYAFDTRPPVPLPPAVVQLQDALTENAALKAQLERRESTP